MSHDEDSATIHKMATFGVCVLDPTRTMSLIPAILQG
uniref:Major capsid protein n=2 Tax=Crassvirales TaxID=1978007 RepID=A0A8S5TSX3_9CAUD|nr:MAG TPA: major capsid protein [CrAss-like virus sp. ct3KQ27]DAK53061.1 MAG TPA: major capsid protein [Crassvirales sp.]